MRLVWKVCSSIMSYICLYTCGQPHTHTVSDSTSKTVDLNVTGIYKMLILKAKIDNNYTSG